ncbi:MAG: hypothetical protein HY051_01090 [Candidatus Aenigmarchaeota archaeon]|nr:hypothetical protein [Candidatus Aenigmarchaeota archaeon]
MRKLYKFSSSVAQGGFLYAQRAANKKLIENKEGLRNALKEIGTKFRLIDTTIKVYNSIFFFFFMIRPVVKPAELIDNIQDGTASFAEWDPEYLYTGVYDLQEEYVRKDLEKFGFDYDKG